MSDNTTNADQTPEQEVPALSYKPDYDTSHIRVSLKSGESHPSEVFAAHIIRNLPIEYVQDTLAQLSETLKENEDHAMGVTWETLRRVLNGEKVADRYLMGAALYLAYTLFDVGGAARQALAAHIQTQQDQVEAGEPTNDEKEGSKTPTA